MWLGAESFCTGETEATEVRMKMLKKNQEMIQNYHAVTEYCINATEAV